MMKIVRDYPKMEYDTIEQAVKDSLIPSAYSYEGQMENIKGQIDNQREFVGKLTDILARKLNFTANEIEELLGYSYTVTED